MRKIRKLQIPMKSSSKLIDLFNGRLYHKLPEAQVLKQINDHAHLEQTDRQGKTVLCRAAFSGHSRIVRKLLAYGADVEGNKNARPLFEAVLNNKPAIVTLLLAHGASTNARTGASYGINRNKTAAELAAALGYRTISRLLATHDSKLSKDFPTAAAEPTDELILKSDIIAVRGPTFRKRKPCQI